MRFSRPCINCRNIFQPISKYDKLCPECKHTDNYPLYLPQESKRHLKIIRELK